MGVIARLHPLVGYVVVACAFLSGPAAEGLAGSDRDLPAKKWLDEFAKAIKKGAKIFRTPGEMGLRDVKIIEKIYQSAENGGKLVSLT